jgi:hypothetical protein
VVKCSLVHALRLCTGRTAHRRSRGIALHFHDYGTRKGWGYKAGVFKKCTSKQWCTFLQWYTYHRNKTFIHLLIYNLFQLREVKGSHAVAPSLRNVMSSLLPTVWPGGNSEDIHREFVAVLATQPYILVKGLVVDSCSVPRRLTLYDKRKTALIKLNYIKFNLIWFIY